MGRCGLEFEQELEYIVRLNEVNHMFLLLFSFVWFGFSVVYLYVRYFLLLKSVLSVSYLFFSFLSTLLLIYFLATLPF